MKLARRFVKWLPRLFAGLGAAFTLCMLFPLAGCLSLGRCERGSPSDNQCLGLSPKECSSIPGCGAFSACGHHCALILTQLDCSATSNCHFDTGQNVCRPVDSANGCSARSVASCTLDARCAILNSCQGDVTCGVISDENECNATHGCYYQQGMT
jgi:hypothetical protein